MRGESNSGGDGLRHTPSDVLDPDALAIGFARRFATHNATGEAGSCTSNNGNVVSQKLTAPKAGGGTPVLATGFGYDAVNRITSAAETGSGTLWSQGFNFGNQFGSLSQTGDGLPSGLNCTSYDSLPPRAEPLSKGSLGKPKEKLEELERLGLI